MKKWTGFNIDDVHKKWARELGGFKIEAIIYATSVASSSLDKAPNFGEFRELCKQYREPATLKLEHKKTDEERKKSKELFEKHLGAFLSKHKID